MKNILFLLLIGTLILTGCNKDQDQDHLINSKIQGDWKRIGQSEESYSITFSGGEDKHFYYLKYVETYLVDIAQGSYLINEIEVITCSNGFQFQFNNEDKFIQAGISYVYTFGNPHWKKQ